MVDDRNGKVRPLLMPIELQWFAKDGEGGEKTEEPTSKKLTDARKDGKVAKSRELDNAIGLITLFVLLKIFVGSVGSGMLNLFQIFYSRIPDFALENRHEISGKAVSALLQTAISQLIQLVIPFFIVGFVTAIAINIFQVKWVVTSKPLQPKLDKFNPINGAKRIFSKESLMELLRSVVKILIIGWIAYSSVKNNINDLLLMFGMTVPEAILLVGDVVINTGLKIALVYLILGLADYMYQKWKFHDDMKMTKQEVKDEYKNSEGDPEIKGKQRARMREASQRRMMQDVPNADVVITNPTHLAVAIKYDAETAPAPVVLAKGADYLAQRIREAAREADVEIVENKPLARMLYANVEIGEEIPPELYQTVAEILAAVYKLKNRI